MALTCGSNSVLKSTDYQQIYSLLGFMCTVATAHAKQSINNIWVCCNISTFQRCTNVSAVYLPVLRLCCISLQPLFINFMPTYSMEHAPAVPPPRPATKFAHGDVQKAFKEPMWQSLARDFYKLDLRMIASHATECRDFTPYHLVELHLRI